MGTDIHMFFEKNIDDAWICYPITPKLDEKYWYEPLFYRSDALPHTKEKAMLKFCESDEAIALEKFEEWCESLDYETALYYFKDNPYVYKSWGYPYDIRSRNYNFFSLLSGIRGETHETLQKNNLGIPNDCCQEIMETYRMEESDSHTASWIMLDELFEHPLLSKERNVQAIKEYFESLDEFEYDKIRMIFWYDN